MFKKSLIQVAHFSGKDIWYFYPHKKWSYRKNVRKYKSCSTSAYFSTTRKAIKNVQQLLELGIDKDDISFARITRTRSGRFITDIKF